MTVPCLLHLPWVYMYKISSNLMFYVSLPLSLSPSPPLSLFLSFSPSLYLCSSSSPPPSLSLSLYLSLSLSLFVSFSSLSGHGHLVYTDHARAAIQWEPAVRATIAQCSEGGRGARFAFFPAEAVCIDSMVMRW